MQHSQGTRQGSNDKVRKQMHLTARVFSANIWWPISNVFADVQGVHLRMHLNPFKMGFSPVRLSGRAEQSKAAFKCIACLCYETWLMLLCQSSRWSIGETSISRSVEGNTNISNLNKLSLSLRIKSTITSTIRNSFSWKVTSTQGQIFISTSAVPSVNWSVYIKRPTWNYCSRVFCRFQNLTSCQTRMY